MIKIKVKIVISFYKDCNYKQISCNGAERNVPHFNTAKIVDKKTVDKRN